MVGSVYEAGAMLKGFAAKTGHPVGVCADVLDAAFQVENAKASERRATDDEKATIHATVKGLDGELTPDLPELDILARAGVRNAQGTRSYARREKKIALLTKASS